MTYRVRISEQADADLRGIYEYIAFNLRSAQNAARQLKRLEKAIYELDTMPNRYPAYKKGKWERRGSVRQYDIEKLKMATVLQNWNRQSRQRLVRNAPAAVCCDVICLKLLKCVTQ